MAPSTVLFLTVCLQVGILILSAIPYKHGECFLCCLGRLSVLFEFTKELIGELRYDPLTSGSRQLISKRPSDAPALGQAAPCLWNRLKIEQNRLNCKVEALCL